MLLQNMQKRSGLLLGTILYSTSYIHDLWPWNDGKMVISIVLFCYNAHAKNKTCRLTRRSNYISQTVFISRTPTYSDTSFSLPLLYVCCIFICVQTIKKLSHTPIIFGIGTTTHDDTTIATTISTWKLKLFARHNENSQIYLPKCEANLCDGVSVCVFSYIYEICNIHKSEIKYYTTKRNSMCIIIIMHACPTYI